VNAECRMRTGECRGRVRKFRLRSGICILHSAFVLVAVRVFPLGAQQRSSITVLVRSSTTQGQLANARVTVTLPSGSDTSIVTDTTGRNVFRRLRPGAYTVRATWGELVSHPAVITLADREAIEVQFTVGPQSDMATRLPELTVTTSRAPRRYMQGFDERRAHGIGQFITREDIETRNALTLADLLRSLRGIRVSCRGGSCTPRMERAPAGCWPKAVLDNSDVDAAFLARISPADIEGIEVYQGLSQAPLEFAGETRLARCGLIVVWTRRPGLEMRPPPGG
jgi:hypothetical protein